MSAENTAASKPPRVVIVIEGGIVQSILADKSNAVELIIKDYDTEGMADNDTSVYVDNVGSKFVLRQGPDQVDAEEVKQCFDQLDAPENRWAIAIRGRPRASWLAGPAEGNAGWAELETTIHADQAATFDPYELQEALADLKSRFAHVEFVRQRFEPPAPTAQAAAGLSMG